MAVIPKNCKDSRLVILCKLREKVYISIRSILD